MVWCKFGGCVTRLALSVSRDGARGGLEGAIAPCRNMLAPRQKVKNYFVGDPDKFFHTTILCYSELPLLRIKFSFPPTQITSI